MARNVEIAREIEIEDLLASKTEGVKHLQEIVDGYPGIWVFHRPQAKEYLEKTSITNTLPLKFKAIWSLKSCSRKKG